MRYAIEIERTDANYGAYVLELPGCAKTVSRFLHRLPR